MIKARLKEREAQGRIVVENKLEEASQKTLAPIGYAAAAEAHTLQNKMQVPPTMWFRSVNLHVASY